MRRTFKTLQHLKNSLPFLADEVRKELEFIADNYTDQRAYSRCKEVGIALNTRGYTYTHINPL